MAFVEDHAAFLTDFGQAATLAGVSVNVIFDNAYAEVYGMATRTPMATLPSADIGSAVQGSTFVTGGVTYRVTAIEPDGTGMTTLRLERS
jgi:hypothetical protein